MLRKIRQVVTGLVEEKQARGEAWDLEPGKGFDPTLQVEETQPATEAQPEVGTFDPSEPGEYVTEVVKTAIENGGKYGEYRVPVWWLRATLADLEGRSEDSRHLWERSDLAAASFDEAHSVDGDRAFTKLFGPEHEALDGRDSASS